MAPITANMAMAMTISSSVKPHIAAPPIARPGRPAYDPVHDSRAIGSSLAWRVYPRQVTGKPRQRLGRVPPSGQVHLPVDAAVVRGRGDGALDAPAPPRHFDLETARTDARQAPRQPELGEVVACDPVGHGARLGRIGDLDAGSEGTGQGHQSRGGDGERRQHLDQRESAGARQMQAHGSPVRSATMAPKASRVTATLASPALNVMSNGVTWPRGSTMIRPGASSASPSATSRDVPFTVNAAETGSRTRRDRNTSSLSRARHWPDSATSKPYR